MGVDRSGLRLRCPHPWGVASPAGDLKRPATMQPRSRWPSRRSSPGAVIRVIFASQDLFADELATYWIVSTHDLGGVIDTVSTTAEITPPLGFLLSWLTAQIGLEPEWVRLPALIAGVAHDPARLPGRPAHRRSRRRPAGRGPGHGQPVHDLLLGRGPRLRGDDGARPPLDAGPAACGRRRRHRWWVAYGLLSCSPPTPTTRRSSCSAPSSSGRSGASRGAQPLLIATGAAASPTSLAPGLKGDLDSPTTDILGSLSPFNSSTSGSTSATGCSASRSPTSAVRSPLRDLPGEIGLLLIAAGCCSALAGLWVRRRPARLVRGATAHRPAVLLALATPFGAGVASLLGTNIFGTRNLAASWPYVALAVAALATAGTRWMRIGAALLLVAGVRLGAVKMLSTTTSGPNYTRSPTTRRRAPGGVVVDGAALTPGPLANFDVEGSDPGGEVFRLNIPEEKRSRSTSSTSCPRPPTSAEAPPSPRPPTTGSRSSPVDPTPAPGPTKRARRWSSSRAAGGLGADRARGLRRLLRRCRPSSSTRQPARAQAPQRAARTTLWAQSRRRPGVRSATARRAWRPEQRRRHEVGHEPELIGRRRSRRRRRGARRRSPSSGISRSVPSSCGTRHQVASSTGCAGCGPRSTIRPPGRVTRTISTSVAAHRGRLGDVVQAAT